MEIIIFAGKKLIREVAGYAHTFCIQEKKTNVLGKTKSDIDKDSGALYVFRAEESGKWVMMTYEM